MGRSSGFQFSHCAPPTAWQSQIQCIWTLEGGPVSGAASRQLIMPCACSDLVFLLGGSVACADSAGAPPGQVLLIGPRREPIGMLVPVTTRMIGVRIKPGSLGMLLGTREADVLGQVIAAPSEPLVGRLATAFADSEPRQAMRSVCRALWGMDPDWRRTGSLLSRSVDFVLHSRGLISVAALAGLGSCSVRQLQREFSDVLGFSPKQLIRMVRFQAALAMTTPSSLSWTEIAAAAGYADQSHLTREFRSFTHCTPGELIGLAHPTLAISRHLSSIDRKVLAA